MTTVTSVRTATASPFDLADEVAYRRWRAAKLAAAPRDVDELIVDVADPFALTPRERDALLERCARANMAVYRGPASAADASLPRALGRQLGLERLDANWLAEEDGISHITVSDRSDGDGGRGGFIPYTDRAIRWHTDGYYHPAGRRIRGMILHCVRPAAEGGVNALLDHEWVYIALRDADPAHIAALMADDAMTIPAREDAVGGVARAAQSGPVFSVDDDGALHMRYTARTRSIVWKDDPATRAAVAALEAVLASDAAPVLRLKLEAGMGIVANNVLHERTAFVDDPARPRLLYRARYLDRVAPRAARGDAAWRNG
ncbi:TauD/TfdA family dioxygenase [Azohydromonas sediminis]|uniref:TauD/TfdA family dioxygenase n=1 Tax=Azohydromonas sediminis TaxID=2259674 RepID=UPI000E64D3A1|nr:TauD/TfdA family dioxygenase [Azohydromonas sediminis]